MQPDLPALVITIAVGACGWALSAYVRRLEVRIDSLAEDVKQLRETVAVLADRLGRE